ncbi:hypothetical protein BC831DRAFT_45025 [Entophlyctis helioformis]|nr:hypothetical protein BC831DRAFT_45025 [Entophlyctis helioformis]
MSLRSIDRIDLAAESEDMLFVAGDYGSATEPGGMFSLMPVESQLFASYVWHIPDLATSTDEKLVSLPFGPRDWSWQIVIYPDGAGDCQGAYASAFIRPIKNETENAAKDAWMRPISSFTFRLRRGARQEPSQERDDEEGGDASLAEPEQAASPDYVLTHVSEPSFTGFSAAQSGWGFEEFYQLPLPHDAISPEDGSVTIEVEVIGPQVIQTGTIQYEYTIPHFAGAARGESSDPHISLPFGPSGCSWVAQVYCQGNNESRGSHVSAYLSPIKSDFEEALGPHWSRAISTFTIKLIHPATRQTIVSKSITGGFLFRDGEALLTGWDQLWPLDRIEEALSGTDTLHLYVAVTWDPLHLAPSTSIGKVRAALAKVSQSQKRYKQAALSYREQTANLTTDLHRRTRELEHSQTRQKAFHDRLSVLQNRLADSQKQLQLAQRTDDEVAALRARVDLLTKELAVARESQMAGERQQIALAQAKLRLTALRTSLDEESFPTADAATASLADNDPAAAASSSDTDPIALQTRIVQLQRNVAELEYDLAQTKSTLNDVMRQQTDAALGEPIEAADAPEPALHDRVQAALSAAVDEINLGSATLEEANSKLSVLGPETRRSERASIVAEIAMIQCGIEVARASLLETYELAEAAGALPIDGFDQVYNDLDMVRSQLGQTRACLEDDSYLYRLARVRMPMRTRWRLPLLLAVWLDKTTPCRPWATRASMVKSTSNSSSRSSMMSTSSSSTSSSTSSRSRWIHSSGIREPAACAASAQQRCLQCGESAATAHDAAAHGDAAPAAGSRCTAAAHVAVWLLVRHGVRRGSQGPGGHPDSHGQYV